MEIPQGTPRLAAKAAKRKAKRIIPAILPMTEKKRAALAAKAVQ